MDKQLCQVSGVDFTWCSLQVEQSSDATVRNVSGGWELRKWDHSFVFGC